MRLTFDIYAIGDVEHRPSTKPADSTTGLTTLRVVARHSRVVSLRPGHAAYLALTATAADTYLQCGGSRRTRHVPAIGNPALVKTLKVMEGSQTVYTHPAFVKGLNPQPTRPATLARLGTERRAHHERTKQQDTTDRAHGDHLHSGLHGRRRGQQVQSTGTRKVAA